MELLGSLLFKLTGTTGRVQTELLQEDESLAAEAQTEIMKQALGTRRRNQVQLCVASEWGFNFRFFCVLLVGVEKVRCTYQCAAMYCQASMIDPHFCYQLLIDSRRLFSRRVEAVCWWVGVPLFSFSTVEVASATQVVYCRGLAPYM